MSLLSEVKTTRKAAPVRVLIHGAGGCGKSTFAASAPRCIFSAAEDGLLNIDAHAFPEPKDWATLLAQIESLATDKHDFQTFALDSLDWAEPLCWAHVCKKANKKDIEAFGYGKGYGAALDEWRVLLHRLAAVRARGMNIVLIAHSVRKAIRNPEGEDYEQWQIKLHEKAAGLIKEWVDVVAFASHEVVTVETEQGSKRHKGIATGKRVLKTQPAAGYDAKTRFRMPKVLPLDWTAFDRAVRAGSASPIEALKSDLDSKLAELGDADIEKSARAYVDERGVSVSSLTDAINTVDSYLAERKKAS